MPIAVSASIMLSKCFIFSSILESESWKPSWDTSTGNCSKHGTASRNSNHRTRSRRKYCPTCASHSAVSRPISELHAEVDRLKKDVYRLEDEKNKSDWHLGEYKQSCNDAKWR